MRFVSISIDNYIAKYLENHPSENEVDIRNRLNAALNDYKKGVKCACGNDIWVIGSASVGNSCYTCITGDSYPIDDYEIDLANHKSENKKTRRHIDDMDLNKIAGFFTDDGYEINEDLIKKPSLCLICKNNDIPEEELLCNMTRFDQKEEKEFKCFAFSKK